MIHSVIGNGPYGSSQVEDGGRPDVVLLTFA